MPVRLAARATWIAVVTSAIVFGASGDRLRACLFYNTVILVNAYRPADIVGYERGAIGIVQPTYERRFLIRAYRQFRGQPTVVVQTPRFEGHADQPEAWLEARQRFGKTNERVDGLAFPRWRRLPDHSAFLNCGDDALAVATRTLAERIKRYGAQSTVVADWLRAQDTVFKNCDPDRWFTKDNRPPGPVVLPDAAPVTADSLVRADRSYQMAAAYFHAMEYEQAEARFRAIAQDRSSPWQPLGRYLAARALIRRESLEMSSSTEAERKAVLTRADADLVAVEADQDVAPTLRISASGLRRIVAMRLRPVSRLHELGARLTASSTIESQDLIDYTALFDQFISPAGEYEYASVPERSSLVEGDDLTDWILAIQGRGTGGSDRALKRWSETRSVPWLVAALWRAPANSPSVPELVRAAADVPADSPAFATAVFLQVRLLLARGERTEARSVLARLPDRASSSTPAEAVNLFRALRLQAAETLEEWLRSAPRLSVASGDSFGTFDLTKDPSDQTFDVDAALAFTESFPLGRLADAAAAQVLPSRLRLMVASQAWTRAVQLHDDTVGERMAQLLRTLSPTLAPDMERYLATKGDERHYAGVLAILRWPTFRNYMPLAESADDDGLPPRFTRPSARMSMNFRKYWWCGFGPMRTWTAVGPYEETPITRLPQIIFQSDRVPPPAFLTISERARAAREFAQLASLGTAPNYLTNEAIRWAQVRPQDPDVAEALARAVTSTKYGCGDERTGALSQRAFKILHRLYPASEWARKTKYWYEG